MNPSKNQKNLFGRQKWPMVLEVRSIMWQIIPGRENTRRSSGVLVVFLDLGASTFLKILVVYLWLAHFCIYIIPQQKCSQRKKSLRRGFPKTILAHEQPARQALRISPWPLYLLPFPVCACSHAHSNTDWICSETEEAASTYLRRTSTFSSQPWPRCSSRAQLMCHPMEGQDWTLYICVGKALLLSIEIQTCPQVEQTG